MAGSLIAIASISLLLLYVYYKVFKKLRQIKEGTAAYLPIGSLRTPLTDLSEKQGRRVQLSGEQVHMGNSPKNTSRKAKC